MAENPQLYSPRSSSEVAFEYSRAAFAAIQEAVLDSACKSPKGRGEGAGVLYGTREGNIVRVQVVRRISCEHARGRMFLLSANDTAALKEQLTRESTEPALRELVVVGWFLSHSAPIRTAMTANGRTVLGSADLQTFAEYFGTPGQVTLVLRPHASGAMQACVFARRADGSVNAEHSDLTFPFTEAAASPDRAKDVELKHPYPSAPAVRETALAAAAATTAATASVPAAIQTVATEIPATSPPAQPAALAPAAPAAPLRKNTPLPASPAQPRIPQPEPAADRPQSAKPAGLVAPATSLVPSGERGALPVSRVAALPALTPCPTFGSYSDRAPRFTFEFSKFFDGLWGVVGLALLAGLAWMPLGVGYYRSLPESAPISLTISERNRQIQVRWNHSSRVIREAAQGSIEILDGQQSRSAALSAEDLSHGSVIFVRQTGEVQVSLEIENAKGQKNREVTHFVGPHP
jgi:hypothetical protein